jgi:hypothetical protein
MIAGALSLLSGIPILSWLKGLALLVVGIFIHRQASAVAARRQANHDAKEIVENHEVAQKLDAATTDEEADHALDGDAQSDRT